MSSRSPVRAAVVGAGLMGRWHARAAVRAGGTVAVIVDSDRSRAQRLARQHGALAVESIAAVSDRVPIDVVHVCTPLATHLPIASEAIARGWHLLVEKPLTATAPETERLLRDASGRNLLLCPVHQFTQQEGVRRVLARRSALGPLLHISFTACSAGAEADPATRDAVADDILPHPLSLVATLLGCALDGTVWDTRRPRPGELFAAATVGEASVSLLISMSGRPTRNELRVLGARGFAQVDLFHGFAVLEAPGTSRSRKIAHPFVQAGATLLAASTNLANRAIRLESAYPGLRALVAAFYGAVRGDGPPPFTGEQILDVARARDALLASSRAD